MKDEFGKYYEAKELERREREKDERETKGRDVSSVRRDPSRSKADQGLKAPKGYSVELERGNPAVAPAEVLPDMSYYISDTMSISSDPCAPPQLWGFDQSSCTNFIDNLDQVIEVDGVGNTTIRKGLLQQTRNAFE